MIIRYLGMLSVLCLNIVVDAAVVISGNQIGQSTSFSFPILPHVYDVHNQVFFVGAQAAAGGSGNVNEYAISVIPLQGAQAIPLASQSVGLDFAAGQANPLYDAGIAKIGLVYSDSTKGFGHPAVVKAENPGGIFFYYDLNSTSLSILQYPQIGDALANPTAEIVGMSTYSQSYLMLAVKPTDTSSSFGDVGSGLALFMLGNYTQGEGLNTKNSRVFLPINPVDGVPSFNNTTKAFPFDIQQSVLTIGGVLTSLGQVVDIHYDEYLNRFYIAVQLQAGPGAADGGKAVVVGYMEGMKLHLASIAPNAAFDAAQNQIVGAVGAGALVSIQKVRTMHTSTNLSYLITLGGNGDEAATARSVYALPLVSSAVMQDQLGTIAKKDAVPVVVSQSKIPYQVIRRTLNTVASQPADMPRDTDAAAVVGGAELDAGVISDIYVYGDTVFVSVGTTEDVNQLPGMYYSQALFDDNGKIKDWTLWRRVGGTVANTFGLVFEPQVGNIIYMTGATDAAVQTVYRTVWGKGSDDLSAPLATTVGQTFEPTQGGIEGLIDIPQNTPGILDISLLISVGADTVALAQTGRVINGVLHPTAGAQAWPSIAFLDGTIQQTLPTGTNTPVIVSIKGGQLSRIQKLVTGAIATNGTTNSMGWLFVGGTHGVAVLSDQSGDGWSVVTGLGQNFAGLSAGMSFKQFGNYSFVRKIVYDSNYLYILTDTQLDRIDLSQGNPGIGQFTAVTVATRDDLAVGSFSDCMISGPLGLLGTTNGLFRVGNGADIRAAESTNQSHWTIAPPIEGTKAVYQIVPITKTGNASDATNPLFDGANVYVLNTYTGKERAQINRYTISSVTTAIDEKTIHVIPDMYVQTIPSFLMNFGALRTRFITDGALFLSARDTIRQDPPLVTVPQASRQPQSGYSGKEIGIPQSQTTLPLDIANYEHVSNMIRLCASGSWFVSGDFGLRINE